MSNPSFFGHRNIPEAGKFEFLQELVVPTLPKVGDVTLAPEPNRLAEELGVSRPMVYWAARQYGTDCTYPGLLEALTGEGYLGRWHVLSNAVSVEAVAYPSSEDQPQKSEISEAPQSPESNIMRVDLSDQATIRLALEILVKKLK